MGAKQCFPTHLRVAIDGPSGSGKSSVAQEVARRLGLAYQDTGAMYRSLTWFCLETKIDLSDAESLERAARDFVYEQNVDAEHFAVFVGKPGGARASAKRVSVGSGSWTEVTRQIRDPSISAAVSMVAGNRAVRAELIRRQRAAIVAANCRMVLEGRDTTSVVVPEAEVRLLLTASEEVRLRRREAQHATEHRLAGSLDEEVSQRDKRDARVTNFSHPAEGVVLLDNSHWDFAQTVSAVLQLVDQVQGK